MTVRIQDIPTIDLEWLYYYITPDEIDPGTLRVEVGEDDGSADSGRCSVFVFRGGAWHRSEELTTASIAAEVRRRRGSNPYRDPAPPARAQSRPTWDRLFLDLASTIARRTTCTRALEAYGGIGAVLVESDSRHILGMGYTGSLPGQAHCTDVGCLILDPVPGCQRSIHAEMNAILSAKSSASAKTLYTNVSPCLKCLQHAVATGVRRVVFAQLYRLHAEQVALCTATGVAWEHADG